MAISRAMKRQFRGLIVKQARAKSCWEKIVKVYKGVEWKNMVCVDNPLETGSGSEVHEDHTYCQMGPSDNINEHTNNSQDHTYYVQSQREELFDNNTQTASEKIKSTINEDHAYIKLQESNQNTVVAAC